MTAVAFPASPAGPGEAGAPVPGRVLDGTPAFRTWNAYEHPDGLTYAGTWEATPGRWRILYDEWECCTVLSGRSVVTPDGAEPIHLGPGDSLVLEPGFAGTWEVVETTRKTYVVRLPSQG